MGGDDSGVIGITQRELLMEMRDDIRALRSVVDSVARDQALSVERRASMQRIADTITARDPYRVALCQAACARTTSWRARWRAGS